jgi:biopolymer transport protein ExbD/biopolymer transport protein TolR
MQFRRARRSPPQLDITPVVDTVFNLMIFFALSLNFIAVPGIPVNLPRASSYAEAQQNKEISISITSDGTLAVNGQPVTRAELEAQLASQKEKAPDSLVVINADTDARHGGVVEVMDIARKAGLSRLAIATQPRPQED